MGFWYLFFLEVSHIPVRFGGIRYSLTDLRGWPAQHRALKRFSRHPDPVKRTGVAVSCTTTPVRVPEKAPIALFTSHKGRNGQEDKPHIKPERGLFDVFFIQLQALLEAEGVAALRLPEATQAGLH